MTIILLFYAYVAFLVLFTLLSLFAVYHILHFGEQNMTTLIMTFLYISVSVIILYFTAAHVMSIDWSAPIPILDTVELPAFSS